MKSLKSLTSAALALLIVFTATVGVNVAQQPSQGVVRFNPQPWLDEAPGFPSNYDAAIKLYNGDNKIRTTDNLEPSQAFVDRYKAFYDKVAALEETLKQAEKAKAPQQQAATEKVVAESLVRTNQTVAAMGGMAGLEKLKQMNPEQRKQAALQMVGNMQVSQQGRNSPAAMMMNSPGMQAFQQKMMTDAAYRTRFEKLSEKEQEAEMRKYMGDVPADTRTAQERQEQQVRLDKNAKRVMNLQLVSELQAMISEANSEFAELDPNSEKSVAIDNSGKDTHAARRMETAERAISEIPRSNCNGFVCWDQAKSEILRKEMSSRSIERNKWELQQKTALVEGQRLQLKALASKFEKWAKDNQDKIGQSADPDNLIDPADLLSGLELGFAQSAKNLTRYSEMVIAKIATDEMAFDSNKWNGSLDGLTHVIR